MSRVFTNNTTNKVTVTAAASINNLAQRTVMAWIKLVSYGLITDTTWFSRGTATFADVSDGTVYPGLTHYGGVDYTITDASFIDITPADAPQLNTWMHVAITLDTSTDNKVHMFVNGTEISSYNTQVAGTTALSNDSATNLLIGSFGAGNDQFTLDGKIYDFRVYDAVLTPSQLTDIVLGGHTIDPLPLNNKCQLTFFANTSPEIDASGNANNGVITGATFSTDNPAISQLSEIISTVPFTDPQGNPAANGLLILDLSTPASVILGGGIVAPTRVAIVLDATGKIPTGTEIYANDDLTPSGTGYFVKLYSSNMSLLADLGAWVISGTSPIDLSQEVSTSLNVSYLNPVVTNPSATQAISGGFGLTLNGSQVVTETASETLTNKTLTSPIINGTPTGTGIQTITGKVGSKGGAYTRSSSALANMDGTNLSYTVTIPTGWKMAVIAKGTASLSAATTTAQFTITDSVSGVIDEVGTNIATTGNAYAWSLNGVITGTGVSRTITLQFASSDNTATVTVANSATSFPTMTFILSPSN